MHTSSGCPGFKGQLNHPSPHAHVSVRSWCTMAKTKIELMQMKETQPKVCKDTAVQAIRQELFQGGELFGREASKRTSLAESGGSGTATRRLHQPATDPIHPRRQQITQVQTTSAANVCVDQDARSEIYAHHAPPTYTPTPLTTVSCSQINPFEPGVQPSTMSTTRQPGVSDGMPEGSRVGWLKAQSPWLRKDGVCIAVFEENSVSRLIIEHTFN